jgi:glycosyltransferase involved in cell wall biosynthesis
MFIYPSRFEGFGIPIIEALQCGIPVIAAKGSCLEEAGGHACVYVDPDDDVAMTNAINLLLKEQKDAERIDEGKKYVEKFHQSKIAKDLMNVYEELIAFKK